MSTTKLWWCAVVLFVGAGCGDDGESSANENEIPSAWPAPAEQCGELGNDCSSCGNEAGEICFVGDPEICVPQGGSALLCSPGSCADESPYCVSGRCLTLEQATCVCAGDVGKELPECDAPSAAAGEGTR